MPHVVIDCVQMCGLHISFCLISSIICRNDSFSGVTMFCAYMQLILRYYIRSCFRGVVFSYVVNTTCITIIIIEKCRVNIGWIYRLD
jgi:hypothetical protein